jgi:hypothetical protein
MAFIFQYFSIDILRVELSGPIFIPSQ